MREGVSIVLSQYTTDGELQLRWQWQIYHLALLLHRHAPGLLPGFLPLNLVIFALPFRLYVSDQSVASLNPNSHIPLVSSRSGKS